MPLPKSMPNGSRVEMKEDEWGRDDELASYTLLVDRIEPGLRLWPLFDNKGIPSQGKLLVKIEYAAASQ